ncbi:MAG: hypothetical protein H7323_09800 [Frankiales bacterium]|nr:hypothetical protein [Frankiales bacterium]
MSGRTTIGAEEDFLADHLAELPADGNRHETDDGLLLVGPALAERHQRVLSELSQLMRASVRVGRLVNRSALGARRPLTGGAGAPGRCSCRGRPGGRRAALDGHDAVRRDRPAVGLLA